MKKVVFEFGATTAIPFQELSNEKLELVLEWRNDPRVRDRMDSRESVSWEEHISFVKTLSEREDRLYLFVEREEYPVGVITLSSIDWTKKIAELGLYRRPDEPGKGHGSLLLITLENVAREIGIVSLKLKVRLGNAVAHELYGKNGYSETGRDSTYCYMAREL